MRVHDRYFELVDMYALDALPIEEENELERHVRGCSQCEAELATALSVTAALIPDSEPPNHVWDRIVSELSALDASPLARERRRKWTWPTVTSVAAAVALALAGILVWGTDARQPLVAAAESAMSDTGSVVADLFAGDVTVAEVVLTADGQGYVLPTESLVPLDVSRTYQLWVITVDDEAISAGVLGHVPRPSAFTWDGEVSGFALTREVAGGVAISAGDVVAIATGL